MFDSLGLFDKAEKEIFNAPANKNIKIWRYMDFTKFVSLLNSKCLHLTRCDQFDDQFEGSAPLTEVVKRLEKIKSEYTDNHKFTPEQSSKILGLIWQKL